MSNLYSIFGSVVVLFEEEALKTLSLNFRNGIGGKEKFEGSRDYFRK